MKHASRLDGLLEIQRHRLDQALAELRARNRQLDQAQLERSLQQERWQAAQDRRRREISRQAEMVRSHAAQTLAAAELTHSGQRIEWWRLRAQEQRKALEAAEAAVLHAQRQADQARRLFHQADARHTGLLQLTQEQQRTQARERLRLEEYASDDVRACGTKS